MIRRAGCCRERKRSTVGRAADRRAAGGVGDYVERASGAHDREVVAVDLLVEHLAGLGVDVVIPMVEDLPLHAADRAERRQANVVMAPAAFHVAALEDPSATNSPNW